MKNVRLRVWTSIVLDFFRNVNLPLSVKRCLTSDIGRVSTFPREMTCSPNPNSEATVADDDDPVVDAIVEERESRRPRSTRVRREENARLTSAGVSVSVSADERGESSSTAVGKVKGIEGRGPAVLPLLQRGNGIERPRGDDGADAGAGVGVVGFGSSNETCRPSFGLTTGSVFFLASTDRGGARDCTSGMYRYRFSVITGGLLRAEGTSHVTESTATLYMYIRIRNTRQEAQKKGLTLTKPVHPAAIASSSTTVVYTKARAAFAPSATLNATPNRMLT
jgi:hypothetical protein